jgi:hypothetical protein
MNSELPIQLRLFTEPWTSSALTDIVNDYTMYSTIQELPDDFLNLHEI